MLDQKSFGEKLRNHRKNLGMTQEEVAEKIGVSAQAVSKWEAGDCLPDLFNLKAITDLYKISADVLLETETSGDIDAVASKIEQISTMMLLEDKSEDKVREEFKRLEGELESYMIRDEQLERLCFVQDLLELRQKAIGSEDALDEKLL